MSDYNIQNVNIKGDNTHFGDKYIFKSYQDFQKANPDLSELEKEIAKKIFGIIKKDEDQQLLLNILQNLSGQELQKVKEKDLAIWEKFLIKLKEAGMENLADKVVIYTLESLEKIPYLKEVFENMN